MMTLLSQKELSASQRLRVTRNEDITVGDAVFIEVPAEDLYAYWRRMENLPAFMPQLESVTILGRLEYYWVVRNSLRQMWGAHVEITEHRSPEMISWMSCGNCEFHMGGTVRLTEALGGIGTILRLTLSFPPPPAQFFANISNVFARDAQLAIGQNLLRLKTLAESHAAPAAAQRPARPARTFQNGQLIPALT